MKSMTLTTCGNSIPKNILELAAEINNKLGDQNFTVAIGDSEKAYFKCSVEGTILQLRRRLCHQRCGSKNESFAWNTRYSRIPL